MDKRYQVFVSSTFTDLVDERRKVIQTLMEMDCIPAGMEIFPAADEDQFEFIKKVIDDCDYYVLIIGGRYGSLSNDGISYTEKEYDYAIQRGLRILAFIHKNPNELPLSRSEKDETLRGRLTAFREKVSKGRLVQEWLSGDELTGKLATSLNKTIKTYPAKGWVRGDLVASAGILNEVNELRKQNEALKKVAPRLVTEEVAGLDERHSFNGRHTPASTLAGDKWSATITWGALFLAVGPQLLNGAPNDLVNQAVTDALYKASFSRGANPSIPPELFEAVKIQFMALHLVDVRSTNVYGTGTLLDTKPIWTLTPDGRELLLQMRSIKKTIPGSNGNR